MGDRIVIAFFEKGRYRISLYDQWGGTWYRDRVARNKVITALRNLTALSNDFSNFITMFIQWYREQLGFTPEKQYNIYLEIKPCKPDHPVIAYDYVTHEVKEIDDDTLLEEIKKVYGDFEGSYP